MTDAERMYHETSRKALLELVDAHERLLDIPRTKELRDEVRELRRVLAELQRENVSNSVVK